MSFKQEIEHKKNSPRRPENNPRGKKLLLDYMKYELTRKTKCATIILFPVESQLANGIKSLYD